MTLAWWELGLSVFIVMAVSISLTTWVIGKPLYSNGYRQATEDVAQAITTVNVVADRMWHAGSAIHWRHLLQQMRLVPPSVYSQANQPSFSFVDAAEAIVNAAIRDKAADDR